MGFIKHIRRVGNRVYGWKWWCLNGNCPITCCYYCVRRGNRIYGLVLWLLLVYISMLLRLIWLQTYDVDVVEVVEVVVEVVLSDVGSTLVEP